MDWPSISYSLTTPGQMHVLAGGAGGYGAVLGAEAELAGRYRHHDDAEAFLASRALLRLLAARLLGVPADEAAGLPVTRYCRTCGGTDHGMPQVPGLQLSMSRTRTLVLAAAGPEGILLGADVEQVPDSVFEGFDESVLSPSERRRVRRGPAGTLERMRLWTAKEAAVKAAGHGFAVEPSRLTVEPDDSTAGAFTARVSCPGTPDVDGLRLGWIPAGEHHLAALASAEALPVAAVPPQALLGADHRLPEG
ncbi:4'-phosphopantetheinyl transferase family protein [Arthrobacter mobilis]|uniref:4-phosphopantetheinyl transferase family protein n=1 Tax=Arthrobacter mobilis TaxID=2724944 RepID=A0A7X6HES6_9MICC|nr:4'-phosphopantetheinyl transferase superfamily protein [Arthrobacter mobilis]NKX55819.1 4-phosphopantetheinyl transferase family protein [Arthrobacter mobilis]